MDSEESSELLKDPRQNSSTVADENPSNASVIKGFKKKVLRRPIVQVTNRKELHSFKGETSEKDDDSFKSRDKFEKIKTPFDVENPSISKATDAVSATTSANINKRQVVKLQKKHLSTASSPILASEKKQVRVPIKKKAVSIQNISVISIKKDVYEGDNNEEAKETDSSSVNAEENSPSKTIIIEESVISEVDKGSGQSVIDTPSENSVTDEGSITSSVTIKSSYLNEEPTKKKITVSPIVSSSQASPYNTRFAHMKIGTIFSVPNRSGGIAKRKIVKENAKPSNENVDNHDPPVRYEKPSIKFMGPDNGLCFLCGIAFSDDMGISLSVKKPLPLSNVDLVSLLESFSISCESIQTQNLSYVNICNVCHTLVIEGDSTYKHLLSVASEMRDQWPYLALKKDPVFSLNFPEGDANNFDSRENVSKSRMSLGKEEAVVAEPKKPRGRVGRPPKLRVKQEEDADENWRPTQVKLERSTHTGRRGRPPKRKIKRERRGRPRKNMIKGEVSEEEVYTCGLCGEEFLDENEWAGHFESVHKTQLRWVNYRSQKKLKKLIMLDLQESFLNETFTEYSCHACDGKFYKRNEFLNHLRHNHKITIDDDFITSLYHYSQGNFENIDEISANDTEMEDNDMSDGAVIKIKKEIIPSSEKSSFKCKVCQLVLDSEKALKDHTDTSHFSLVVIANDDTKEVVLPEEKTFGDEISDSDKKTSNPAEMADKGNGEETELTCEDCEEVFYSRHRLLEHKLNIHGSNDDKGQEKGLVRYECEVCGRRIYGMAALRVHMTKVHYKTLSSFKHSCSMCVYKSQSRSQLGKHMRSKHGKEIMPSVQCETCGKMYGPSYIAKHIATMHSTHTRNYNCNFCDMKFYDMAGLKFHIYHEHANKVWKCNKCPKEFKKYHQLRQHRIFTHSNKIHACMECPKTYKRRSDLTEHIKRLHLQRVVLLCPRCPKQYVNRFKLRNHLMKHHDVPWEDTLARNYARHQRANNCRRTEDGILEVNKDQPPAEESSIFIEESYDHFDRREKMQEEYGENFEGQVEHEYHDHFSRHNEEHEYHAHYRETNDEHIQHHQSKSQQLASVKMEKDDHPEEYIEIMEATDAFAKDGITYVIIEET